MTTGRVYISVINDIATDQRVNRVAGLLLDSGLEVICIGRRLRNSPSMADSGFRAVRFKMIFNKGPLFYACFNMRLLTWLLFAPAPVLLIANDLDTLPANYLAGKFRKVKLIYDSHEFFTQVPELINRHTTQKIWIWIERSIVPRLDYAVTVSYPIAELYRRLYGIPFKVVRNLPVSRFVMPDIRVKRPYGDSQLIIYQGALNVGRGLELMLRVMQHLEGAVFLVAGSGDIEKKLHKLGLQLGLGKKVVFLGRLMPSQLRMYTEVSDLGISLEEDRGLNYRYALPNKLFDYIQSRVPVLCSALPEMKRVVETYGIGVATLEKDPGKLAGIIRYMLEEHAAGRWKEALDHAAEELCWENESQVYLDLLDECNVLQKKTV